jgi:uncharacterized protein
MLHSVIVPGVGGSEFNHWQSLLQRQLMSCSRVEQHNWNTPILNDWVARFVETVQPIQGTIQIIAHSFGCLTTLAALAQHPEIAKKVKNLVLVAPANPIRFGEQGFARVSPNDYQDYFLNLKVDVPASLLISENDPWLKYEDALVLADAWHLRPVNMGQVGHINVASGFGPFPEIHNFLISENFNHHINYSDDHKYLFKFAF